MKTITVDVWDCGTGQTECVRSWTVDENDAEAVSKAKSEAMRLFDGLAQNDHSTDHVPILSERG